MAEEELQMTNKDLGFEELTEHDLAALRRCAITPDVAASAQLSRVDGGRGAELVGRTSKTNTEYAGIVFPYLMPSVEPNNQRIREYRLRRDRPDHEIKSGKVKEKAKYLSPPGRSNLLYFPPGTTIQMLDNVAMDILIVEGEKKTLACNRATGGSILVIGVPGVYGWRGARKIDGPNGRKTSVSAPIQDLELIVWKGRNVTILYDRDADENALIASARLGLVRELRSRGAVAKIASMPLGGPDKGIDDLIGRVEFEEGFEAACAALKKILVDAAVDGLSDYVAFAPDCSFIHTVDSQTYIAKSLDTRFPKVAGLSASKFLLTTNAVNARTWAPGEPKIIQGKMLKDGGWQNEKGYRVYNEYCPPTIRLGNPEDAHRWLELVKKIYPDDWKHIVWFLAHRVQRPAEKINHGLVLGGSPGIGKDTVLEPVIEAVGRANWEEIGPHKLFETFNDYLRSVVLRISETRDMGEGRRSDLYERLKTITTAPPDSVRINRKNIPEFRIPNLTAVIATTNHTNGLYLPPDDRRFYVAWSDVRREEFNEESFPNFYQWLDEGGREAVAAFLNSVDLSHFDPKAPPPKTIAWQRMVDAGRSTEDVDIANALEQLGWPDAVTIEDLRRVADPNFRSFLDDRKNHRPMSYRFEEAGYIRVPNPGHKQRGLWKIVGRYQVVYANRELTESERFEAARALL